MIVGRWSGCWEVGVERWVWGGGCRCGEVGVGVVRGVWYGGCREVWGGDCGCVGVWGGGCKCGKVGGCGKVV